MKWFAILLASAVSLSAATTWYVDLNATGANNGTSPANAWTDLQFVDRSTGNVHLGDTVVISAGEYTNYAPVNLQEGSSGVWVRYIVTNGLVHIHRPLGLRGWTSVDGRLNRSVTASDNLYGLDSITNNCGLWIDRHDVTNGLVSGFFISDEPTVIYGVENTGAPSTPSPGDTLWNVDYNNFPNGSSSLSNEFGYCWINYSSGRGTTGDMAMDVPGTTWDNWNIHHCIFENNQSDVLHPAKGTDFHHNIIRNRSGAWGGGCNDTFVIGDPTYVRIYNNLIEAADNTLGYLWGAPQFIHDFYFYNNVLTPVKPAFQVPGQTIQGSWIIEQDTLTQGVDYQVVSNIYFVNNSWVATTNDSVNSMSTFVTKNTLTNNIIVASGAMHYLNNLCIDIDTTPQSPRAPFGFNVSSTSGSGSNDAGKGWFYTASSIELDYNWFGAYFPGNVHAAGWGQSGDPVQIFTNAADIQRVLGWTHNKSDDTFRFVNAPGYNYQPSSPVLIGTNLTSLLAVMPSINETVYGTLRPASGPWNVGAADPPGLLAWYTFSQSDGWTTNGILTDWSGNTNTAYQFPSTNHSTLPTYTNGPVVNGVTLDAAQFVVNRTNTFTYGTYFGVPLTNAANQTLWNFTNGTWALWARVDSPHLLTDNDDIFLTVGQQQNNWMFGKYYSDGPQFSRVTSTGGQEPMETYSRWPNLTTNAWHHYAVTWDGKNWLAYLDGVLFTNSASFTNANSFVLTNQYTGSLVSTGNLYNWMGIGVNTHSGTPNPDDADGLPNNGQLWGSISDVRIYNRQLSALEIQSIVGSQGADPVITIQPQSAIIYVNQSALFSITASGQSTLSYQWKTNGVNAGTNGPLLSVNSAPQAWNGMTITCTVSDTAGPLTSQIATLTVTPDPHISTQPKNQTVTVGQSATFTVFADGVTPLSYQWSRNGSPIAGATLSSFATGPNSAGNSGDQYSVAVTDANSTLQSQNAILTVVQDPLITVQPQNQTVLVGQSVTFSVTATGQSPRHFQWTFNGANVGFDFPGYTRNNCQLPDSGGLIQVTASDLAGSVQSVQAVLTVNSSGGGGPTNVSQITNLRVGTARIGSP